MRFRYTDEMLAFLRAGYPLWPLEVLTEEFNENFCLNVTQTAVKSALKNHSITCGRNRGELNKGKLREFTREQFEFIREAYKSMTIEEIKDAFNERFGTDKTHGQIRNCTRNHKLLSGRTGQFEKGGVSWNKGRKCCTGFSSTRFKKGNVPHTHLPVGSEVVDGEGYLKVKVAEPNIWKFQHRLVWEAEHGPSPEGMMIKFIDGDKRNIALENLELISRAENAILNKMHYSQLPKELQPSARLVAKIHIKRREAAA